MWGSISGTFSALADDDGVGDGRLGVLMDSDKGGKSDSRMTDEGSFARLFFLVFDLVDVVFQGPEAAAGFRDEDGARLSLSTLPTLSTLPMLSAFPLRG